MRAKLADMGMGMEEPPGEIAPLFAVERARLTGLLRGLAPADWQRPSPCPGWTVLGLCTHLVGDDLSYLARHRDGYLGTPGPDGDGEDEFIAWLDALQAEWVRAARRLSPRIVIDLLEWAEPQIAGTLRGEDPRARTASVSWAGTGPVPAWLDQARELSEYWIHRQQLLQALSRPSDLRPDIAGPVLDALRWAYPFRLGQVRGEPGDTVAISVSGPVARTWYVVAVAVPAGWEFRDQPGPRAAASMSMTTEQAWRLLTNNLPAAGRSGITASGDETVLGILFRTRAIIGTPNEGAEPAQTS
ncbi:MAG TPA: maleylpyruvate isomerase N-terminal domain-containing protein [Trebonia sp.]|nr:maleylpyruvate isomerase N-terminal domain-containing protein [Trebonia sp.]